MIGLVSTYPRVSSAAPDLVCGYTPMDPGTVRRIWYGEIAKSGIVPLLLAAAWTVLLIANLATGFQIRQLVVPCGAMTPFALMCMFVLYMDTKHHWKITDEISAYQWGSGFYYDRIGDIHALPHPVIKMVQDLQEAGLTPLVEYTKVDPFLLVEIDGKRVYLYHW